MNGVARAPVAVIGAGVIGIACARALQRAGQQVVVLDPNPPGSGVSYGNSGHIAFEQFVPLARPEVLRSIPRLLLSPLSPLTVHPLGMLRMLPWMLRFALAARPLAVAAGTEALAHLAARAKQAWSEEAAASGLEPLIQRRGALLVYEHRSTLAANGPETRTLRQYGIRFTDLSDTETSRLVPGLALPIAGGRVFHDNEQVTDPHRLVVAMAERFVADGGAIERCLVTGFDTIDRRVSAVRTTTGRMPVSALVLAAGATAGSLARALGANAPLTKERGYHVMLPGPSLSLEMPVSFAERGFIAAPLARGVRLAGTVELGGTSTPNWRRADILVTHMRRLFGRPDLSAEERWSGDRPTLPDYLPMIGCAPHASNAVLALGHQHLGLTLATITGRLVAELVAGQPASSDLRAFRTDRFARLRA